VCCYNHDQAYWLGGTKKKKDIVDHKLRQCVKEHFSSTMGVIMYLGVSFGGLPEYKTEYRWGYGWTYDRGYLEVTKTELEYAKDLLPKKGESIWKYIKK
jgi:hypothetical protein